MRRSSLFRQQWRLLIKAKYWSFSSLHPPPLIFISLSLTPRGGEASIWRWEVIEQVKDCRHSLCGLKGVCMCVFFGQAPSHLIWVSFHPRCHNVLLYSVKNQHWPCCSGDHFQSFTPMHTEKQLTFQYCWLLCTFSTLQQSSLHRYNSIFSHDCK